MSSIQVLFLHHLDGKNDRVAESNIESFRRFGNDVVGICDEDSRGLPGSVKVPLNGRLPRGPRWASADTVYLNYLLDNRESLTHSHYMFCEYDCLCECNLDIQMDRYLSSDVCAPHVVTQGREPEWGWFKSMNIDCPLIGLRPAVFLLFSKESILRIADTYTEIWPLIKDSNCEARLGSVAALLGMNICQFVDVNFNASWGPARFMRNSGLYHPVKEPIKERTFLPRSKNCKFAGVWEFGRVGREKMNTLILQTDGTIQNNPDYNESYWFEEGDDISFYSGRGGLTSKFSGVKKDGSECVGDYYDGNISGESLLSASHHWIRRVLF